jgi:hypothetical protein
MARRQRWQGEPSQRTLAALRAAGENRACPLPQPLGDPLDRTGGWSGWVVEPLAALAQGTRLAPVGQETNMAHALQALGHDRQEKAADELMRLPRQGLHAVALASIAVGKTPLAILPSDDAVVGDGHAVRVAPERGQHRPRAYQRLLGVDDPRLGIQLGDESSEALRGREGRGGFRHHHRS